MPTARSEEPQESGTPMAPAGTTRRKVPSVLDLVRLSPEPVFPPGGESLYRQIAVLTEMRSGKDVLDVACGRGLTTEFLAENYGVEAIGIDPDPDLIADAEQRTRTAAVEEKLTFQTAAVDDLPYKDDVFDISIGELGLCAEYNPGTAVRELARVTKPFGTVVLVQLVWTGNVDEPRRGMLVEYLGARPLLLMEWKQMLREAGCVDLRVEDWSDTASAFRPEVGQPFHDFAEIFTLRQKLAILRRAMRRWGIRGVRGAVVREQEIHRLLSRERVLGLSLIVGTKWPRERAAGQIPAD